MVTQKHGEFVYVGDAEFRGHLIHISDAEAHHLTRVRRVRFGDEVMATDGKGVVYRARRTAAGDLEILEELREFGESRLNVTLVCGILASDSSKDVVSIAVQLGVQRIVWARMKRSQESNSEHKLDRFTRVAIHSMKQTGRARLPGIEASESLEAAMDSLGKTTIWVAHPDDLQTDAAAIDSFEGEHCLVVGPEGGFSREELEFLRLRHASFIRLGLRRLRTETAVAAGLTVLLAKSNEL